MAQTKLLVVGCPRGGTSFMAAYLRAMGLRTIEDKRVHPDYPAGFGEHMPILLFNKMCERLRGSRDRLTTDLLIERGFLEDPYIRQCFDLAFEPFRNDTIDFIKVPALGLALEFMAEEFADLKVLAVFREPLPNMKSFYRREFGRWKTLRDRFTAIGCWNMYALRMLQFQAKVPDRCRIISVDDMVRGLTSVFPLLRDLGIQVPKEISVEQALQKSWQKDVQPLDWRIIVSLCESLRYFAPVQFRSYFSTSINHQALQQAARC